MENIEIKIPPHLKSYYEEKLKKAEIEAVDFSLSFEDRKYAERAIKSYGRRLRKMKRQEGDRD